MEVQGRLELGNSMQGKVIVDGVKLYEFENGVVIHFGNIKGFSAPDKSSLMKMLNDFTEKAKEAINQNC